MANKTQARHVRLETLAVGFTGFNINAWITITKHRPEAAVKKEAVINCGDFQP